MFGFLSRGGIAAGAAAERIAARRERVRFRHPTTY